VSRNRFHPGNLHQAPPTRALSIPLRIKQNYTRPERRRLEALLVRASHIDERIKRDGTARHTHDASELSAIGWALAEIMATRGALPEDLDRLRAEIWEQTGRIG
jgi:hypothetical protein